MRRKQVPGSGYTRSTGRRSIFLLMLCIGSLVLLLIVAGGASYQVADDSSDCDARRSVTLPSAKLFIEHNATDEDTGVHGLFDGTDWTRLTVFDPSGKQILEVEPTSQLKTQSISGIFFESAEPPNDEVPISEILNRFPEGRYRVGGCSADGERLRGSATFTHKIPAEPEINYPQEGSVVPATGFAVSWNHVDETINGEPIDRTGYQVIVTKDVPDDPNGFSRPTLDIHVPPSVTSLMIPAEFLEPGTRYELEVLVLEVSGNQTISVLFFVTSN